MDHDNVHIAQDELSADSLKICTESGVLSLAKLIKTQRQS